VNKRKKCKIQKSSGFEKAITFFLKNQTGLILEYENIKIKKLLKTKYP